MLIGLTICGVVVESVFSEKAVSEISVQVSYEQGRFRILLANILRGA